MRNILGCVLRDEGSERVREETEREEVFACTETIQWSSDVKESIGDTANSYFTLMLKFFKWLLFYEFEL